MTSLQRLSALTALSVLVACGGGGGDPPGGTVNPISGVISGTATKGPLSQSSVIAYGIRGGQMGDQIATATTDADGNFTLKVGSYAGPLMLQISGGSYIDEATGVVMAMAPGDVMTALMSSIAAGSTHAGIQVTPITAMAQAMAAHMAGGMTDANIAAASAAMGRYFEIADILHVRPMNPLVSGSGAIASLDAQNYGMAMAAMSKYAQTQGMSSSSAIVTAMMNDASDGVMNGWAGSVPVQMGGMVGGKMLPSNAAGSGMGSAMQAFMSSAQNRSGLTGSMLMDRMMGSPSANLVGGPPLTGPTLSGTIVDGRVNRATVMAYAIDRGARGAQIASAATDAEGRFTLALGSYSGPVMLQVGGGLFTDDANWMTMMGSGNMLAAAVPAIAAGANVTGIEVTAVTSMAQARATGMAGGMTESNIAAANKALGDYFLVNDILRTQPMNPQLAGSGASASPGARNYGMTLAAVSQLAKGLNLQNSSALIAALMTDAADGILDGRRGASRIVISAGGGMMMGGGVTMASDTGTSAMAQAMTTFANSAANVSGVTAAEMNALIQRLVSTTGQL